ncbi:alpha-keto acid decarboxylase family protein [Tundrisphaera sp. TA3]|uniref:alpha-keto acid decarboxylase family protein n=1 Tax=Tundrisphaera sp. TA3 TaxID=3435775 RepID=UPI003EBA0F4F
MTRPAPSGQDAPSTVGRYLASRFEQLGLRHYFAVPGDFNLILLDELLTNPRVAMIGCCNELNAGYAADGYARANGLAAVVLTFGVGGLSALNAVACAYAEDLPILVVVGGINSGSAAQGHLIHHTLGEIRYDYHRKIFAEVTAGVFPVDRPEDAPAQIDRAIETALRRRKPVLLEIACNVAGLPVPAPQARSFESAGSGDPSALADAVAHVAAILDGADRPVLVGGSKLRLPGVSGAFRALADASGYGVSVMPGGKGMFPEDHPGFLGLYWGSVGWPGVAEAVESSGAALLVGTLLSDYATVGFTADLDPGRTILAMPDEIRTRDAVFTGVNLADFLAALGTKVRRNEASRRRSGELGFVSPSPEPAPTNEQLSISDVARQVKSALDANSALLVETGDSWFHGLETRLPAGCRFEIQFQAGSIGWSVPAALGYELGSSGSRRVITMVGDGSFQLTAQEVSTMIRYGMRPILILVNNHGYIIEDAIHKGPYNKIKNWDYAGLMAIFTNGEGAGLGLRAKTPGELSSALGRARDHAGPCLIEVEIAPDDCSPTMKEWGVRVAAANRRPAPA